MKTLRSKLLVTAAAALGGLILYDVSMQLGEAFHWIDDRHPDMGLGGWLLFRLWGLSGAAVGVVSHHFWKAAPSRRCVDALMLLYMTISTLIYMLQTG